ncbi:hypothetical protein EDB19DRAFT_1955167 [Suillus lakei]|nr:hypothetical protein EDB19DRAFT_1955167 [Suillus lakei]
MSAENAKFVVKNLFNVEGWVCVVTGGGTGIGLMIAQAFANNGAKVYITSRRQDVLEHTAKQWGSSLAHPKGKLIPVACDVTSKDSIKNLVQEISKQEDRIDLLVNNAGISEGKSNVEKGDQSVKDLGMELFGEDQASWENVYRTNSQHTGSVINITSISGITRTTQYHYKYNVSKAAAIHVSTLLAQEFRRKAVRVRVNNIAPGIFPSEMTTASSDELNKSQIPLGEDYGENKGIPAGRPGRDEDIAQAALMLACNQYAYGQTLTIDGGYLLEHP